MRTGVLGKMVLEHHYYFAVLAYSSNNAPRDLVLVLYISILLTFFLHLTWILFGSLRIIFSRKTARPQFTPKKNERWVFCTKMAMLIDADGCFTVLTQPLRAINIHENTERSTFSPQTLNLFTTWRREMGERENCIFHHNYLPLPQIHIYLPPRMMVFNSGFQFPLSSCFPVHWNNNNLRRLATKIEHFLAFFMASKEILRIPTITWVSHCFMSWYVVARNSCYIPKCS